MLFVSFKARHHPHLESRSFAIVGAHFNVASHAFHDLLADVQSDAGTMSIQLLYVFRLAEQLEQIFHVLRVNTDTSVRDLDDQSSLRLVRRL